MFWSQLNKGKVLSMKTPEAYSFLTQILSNRDQAGNTFVANEVDMDEVHGLLEQVISEEGTDDKQVGGTDHAALQPCVYAIAVHEPSPNVFSPCFQVSVMWMQEMVPHQSDEQNDG